MRWWLGELLCAFHFHDAMRTEIIGHLKCRRCGMEWELNELI